jgi:hypothetical protein
MVLLRGICHMSSGERDGDFSTMILSRRSALVKAKTSNLLAGRIECCLVYELVDQRNEHKSITIYHQVFIAVKVSAIPLINMHKASAVMFMAREGEFTGSKDDMKRLKKKISRNDLIDGTYFICSARSQTLRLKAVFHPGRYASIEVTLEKAAGYVENDPIPFK